MNSIERQPLLLVGVGGAGRTFAAAMAKTPACAPRTVFADTDAAGSDGLSPFVLLGGDRLSGRGTGGDMVLGRLAAEDSATPFASHLEGVRLAVVVAGLGGGTGGGAAPELVSQIASHGIPVLVFATMPFSFEGDVKRQKAQRAAIALEEAADAFVPLSLDALSGDPSGFMDDAMARASVAFSGAASLFWRMLEKPGYLKIDVERARRVVSGAGRGRFAAATAVSGENRSAGVLEALSSSPLLAAAQTRPASILCGILAGSDLRLAEVGEIAEGVRDMFGRSADFNLATVNDEERFGGAISAAVLVFESSGAAGDEKDPQGARGRKSSRRGAGRHAANPLSQAPQGRGRFNNIEPTVWNGEDLDVPTFVRRNITLDL